MIKCQIQWVADRSGTPTPDENPAIGDVWIEPYDYTSPRLGKTIRLHDGPDNTPPRRYPICAEHAKRLPIQHWHFEKYQKGGLT